MTHGAIENGDHYGQFWLVLFNSTATRYGTLCRHITALYVTERVTHAMVLECKFDESNYLEIQEVYTKGKSGSSPIQKARKGENRGGWFGVSFQLHEISDTISRLPQEGTEFGEITFTSRSTSEIFRAVSPARLIDVLNDAAKGEPKVFVDYFN